MSLFYKISRYSNPVPTLKEYDILPFAMTVIMKYVSLKPIYARDNGLSEYKKKVIAEMHRLGMIIDLSHISDHSFYDVVKLSKVLFVDTYSCTCSLRNHRRNMRDEMIITLAENGGVIQVTLGSSFIKKLAPTFETDNTIQQLRNKYERFENLTDWRIKERMEKHNKINESNPLELATLSEFINHKVKLFGIAYIGIGSDFDGGGQLKDCYDVSEIENIKNELVRRGYSEEEITKIWRGNFMRVFKRS